MLITQRNRPAFDAGIRILGVVTKTAKVCVRFDPVLS